MGINDGDIKAGVVPFAKLTPLYERHYEEYDQAVSRVMHSGWYIMGPKQPSKRIARYVGCLHCRVLTQYGCFDLSCPWRW